MASAARAPSRRRRAGSQTAAVRCSRSCCASSRFSTTSSCASADGRVVTATVDGVRLAAGGARSVLSGARRAAGPPSASWKSVRSPAGRRCCWRIRCRGADRAMVGVLGISLNLQRLEPLFANIPLPTDRSSRWSIETDACMARSQRQREVHRRGVRSAARAEGCAAHPSAARSRRGRAVSRQRGHRTRSVAAERRHSAQRGVRARRSRSTAATSRSCPSRRSLLLLLGVWLARGSSAT